MVPVESAEMLASLRFLVSAEIKKLAEAAISSGRRRENSISLEKLFDGLIVISSPSEAVPRSVMLIPLVDIEVRPLASSVSDRSYAIHSSLGSE